MIRWFFVLSGIIYAIMLTQRIIKLKKWNMSWLTPLLVMFIFWFLISVVFRLMMQYYSPHPPSNATEYGIEPKIYTPEPKRPFRDKLQRNLFGAGLNDSVVSMISPGKGGTRNTVEQYGSL